MLTIKKRGQIFLTFFAGLILVAGWTGCAPAGVRALKKGEQLLQRGKYSEAVKKFEEAVKAFPENAKAWNHLGLGYQYAGEPKKAAQAYQEALSLDRNFATASYNLGILYLEHRNYPAAAEEFTTFAALQPKNPQGWLKLGEAQLQLAASVSSSEKSRHLDAAKRNFETSHKLSPSADAQNALGMIQMQRGRPREAALNFSAALQLEPAYSPALLNLAVVNHQYLGDLRLALLNYKKYLEAVKNSPDAHQVQLLVRQLENELNPVAVAAASSANVSKPMVPVDPKASVSSSTRTETNQPKVAPAPKSAQTISQPSTQAVSPKKEAPVEVAKVSSETPVKPTQDVTIFNSTKTTPVVRKQEVVVAEPTRETKTQENESGVFTKLNPANWFKRRTETGSTTTELPAAKPPIESGSSVEKTEEKTALAKSDVPRYRYRSPQRPIQGDRIKAEPYFTQGVAAQRNRQLTDAIANYRKALKLDPSYFEANYNLALVAREAGDLSAALHAYELALAVTPDSINARYNFAFTLQELGYFLDAAHELRKLLAQKPNETRAHLLLGNLYAQRLGQRASAREHYLKVLETEPQHPQGTQIRYWLAAHP